MTGQIANLSLLDLLLALEDAGIQEIYAVGDKLRFMPPCFATPELRAGVEAHRATLLQRVKKIKPTKDVANCGGFQIMVGQ